ncbi:MAG: FUSC family protein, partial [Microvirga sp.]
IGCATLVSQLIFPVTAGAALKTSVETTIGAVSRWIADVLRAGDTDERALSDKQVLADQRRMVADVIALDALRVFSTFDTPSVRAASDVARHLQGQILGLLSLMISIHDRMSVLRTQAAAQEAALRPLLARTADLLDPDRRADLGAGFEAEIEHLQGDIDAGLPTFADMVRDRETILVRNILLRLRDVLGTWRRILELRDGLFAGKPVSRRPLSERPLVRPEAAPSSVRYRDVPLALAAGAISATAVLATSAFWVVTGWPQGSSAVIFSGVICSILASLDDPATAAANFLRMTVYAALAAAFYAFWVLPRIDGFASLAMVLLPFYLPFGILLALPRVGTQVTPLGLNLAALIGLTNTGVPPDFAAFLNSTLALLLGIAAGILAFRLLRPLGVEWAVRRIRRSALRDLQVLAEPATAVARTVFIGRMLDRIGALFTRIDGEGADQRDILRGSLAALRIGLNVIALKQHRRSLPPALAAEVETTLSALARHFRRLKNDRPSEAPLPVIHHAITTILSQEPGPYEDTLTALVAIAGALARHAGYFGVADPAASLFPLSAGAAA